MIRRSDAMARTTARGLLALGVVVLAACAAPAQQRPAVPAPSPANQEPAPPPAPVRAAPTRPAHLWGFTRLQGEDYVSLAELAEHFDYRAAWVRPGLARTLADKSGVRWKFETNQRDCYFDGVRVFLSLPAVLHRGELWVGRLDVIKTLAPLMRPEAHAAQLPEPPRVVVLDPGHGGTDPGKQNLRLKLDEKDMTLDVALRLRKILEARGYTVLMTRTTDTRFANSPAVDLPLRAEVANKAKADLFLSIHFNAVDPRDAQRVSGSETYVLTPQFMVSTQPESDKSMIPVQNPGNRQDVANVILGYQLHRRLLGELKTSDRGFKRYRLAVLRTLNCPGALVEAAYLSNDTEAARVATPEFRQQIAEAIAAGVGDYAAMLAALRPPPTQAK
jgi:N-acetylmuramoyl-L-alanine amidase